MKNGKLLASSERLNSCDDRGRAKLDREMDLGQETKQVFVLELGFPYRGCRKADVEEKISYSSAGQDRE